jgi:hypothetical protein
MTKYVYKLHEMGEGNPLHPLVFSTAEQALTALIEEVCQIDPVEIPNITREEMHDDIESGGFHGENFETEYPELREFIVDRLQVV